jgi:DNA-binding transcriptional MerR regulator
MFIFDLLSQQRNREFVGTTELAAAATEMILTLGPVQDRGTVKDVVEERTVRYYQSEGLLETPSEKRGTASVFGYKHLLTLVVIKTMQSKNLPIRKIKEIIREKSEGELEQLYRDFSGESSLPQRPGSEAREYLSTISEPEEWEPQERTDLLLSRMSRPLFSTDRGIESVRFSRAVEIPDDEPDEQESSAWLRHKLGPGIELQIRTDVMLRLATKDFGRVLEKVKRLLKPPDDT